METGTRIILSPLEDRVIVRPIQPKQMTASGLVIPETASEKPQEGEVVAAGPGAFSKKGERVPLDIQVGDIVLFGRYGGTEVKYHGEEYLIFFARDVLAIIDA